MVHNLMEISLAPSIPTSLRVIPTKHNIIIRLWTHTFHKLREALRRASFASPLALEYLQDFIYFTYTFYTGLLKEPSLRTFYSGWLEALGDLARYRMAATAMVTSNQLSGCALAAGTISQANAASADDVPDAPKSKSQVSVRSSSYRPAARVDDSPTPSIGIVAARMMQVEPKQERWRGIAKE
jgi:protein SMG6